MTTRIHHVSPDVLYDENVYADPDLLWSVIHHGVLLPVLVQKRKGGGYDVIDGHKRVACVRLANDEHPDLNLKVPIRVVSGDIESIREEVNRPVNAVVKLPDWLLEAWTQLRGGIQTDTAPTVTFELEEGFTTIHVACRKPIIVLDVILDVITLRGDSSFVVPNEIELRGHIDGRPTRLCIRY